MLVSSSRLRLSSPSSSSLSSSIFLIVCTSVSYYGCLGNCHQADLATEPERQLTTESARKGLNTTSGAQFVALRLVKPSNQLFHLRAPSSTDVPVLLLNQPIISRKQPAPVTDTFFVSRACPLTRASTDRSLTSPFIKEF